MLGKWWICVVTVYCVELQLMQLITVYVVIDKSFVFTVFVNYSQVFSFSRGACRIKFHNFSKLTAISRPSRVLFDRSWRRCLKKTPMSRRNWPRWSPWATLGLVNWLQSWRQSSKTTRRVQRYVSTPSTPYDVSPNLPESRFVVLW